MKIFFLETVIKSETTFQNCLRFRQTTRSCRKINTTIYKNRLSTMIVMQPPLSAQVPFGTSSVSGNGKHLSFLTCKKKKVRNFEKYRLIINGFQKIYKHQIHGCWKSNPKIYKHRIHGRWKSNHKLYKHQILRRKTNQHHFSCQMSTLKTNPGDKSFNPLSVCIKQLDATFSDCLCSCAPIGILFSGTIIEDFLRHLCILRIFSTTAYICFWRTYSI